ncbi:hypothetical protein BT96DRAFT_916836 [Gymnopus androsaceus JB14]|uniref:Uncharacterized protein n=1 Tax=Gymnopus androsaceus JB14 TaxID=1447944 RepID=A0A6A4I3G4_9AGAR|nr:hypothetical protein BT96DRAFT_916836 [Gymnopus androsaceus JB14]
MGFSALNSMPPCCEPQSSFQLRTKVNFAEIRQRLRSEYGSAVQSEAEISGTFADVDQDIDDCGAEVRRLQSRIVFLQNQRQRLMVYKNCLCFLRSPIRKLPNETVLRIFDFACDMNELTSKKLQTMPALVISGVCARWRDLARSCPELWSRIKLEMWTTPRHLADLPILHLYLQYSQQSPLIVEIPDIKVAIQGADHLAVCATLSSCSNRWKSLASPYVVYEALMAQNPTDFPVLEQLLIPNIFFYKERSLNRFQHASNLKALGLCHIERWEDSQQRKFPWTQVTKIDVAQCEDMMKPIFEMHSLQGLRFRQSGFEGAVKLCSPPITTPSVQKLALTLTQTSYPESERLANVVFSSIACPSLTSLVIEGLAGYKHVWPRDAVNGFISRSSFHLTTLSIKFVPLSDSDLIDVLRRLPSLVHLTVDDSNIPTNSPNPITLRFVQSLHAFPHASSAIIPSVLMRSLKSLSLTFSGSDAQDGFDDRGFVDVISSRWFPDHYANRYGLDALYSLDSEGGIACLRSVVMRFTSRDVDEEIYSPLKNFEEEGMMVVVVGQSL